jgi:hypothetical protein
MGGRGARASSEDEFGRRQYDFSDREEWIKDVSDKRLEQYESMLSHGPKPFRLDGSGRVDQGQYFADLIRREKSRRSGE